MYRMFAHHTPCRSKVVEPEHQESMISKVSQSLPIVQVVYLRRRKTWQYDWDKNLKCQLIPKEEVARAAENLLRPDPNYDENAVLPVYSEVVQA